MADGAESPTAVLAHVRAGLRHTNAIDLGTGEANANNVKDVAATSANALHATDEPHNGTEAGASVAAPSAASSNNTTAKTVSAETARSSPLPDDSVVHADAPLDESVFHADAGSSRSHLDSDQHAASSTTASAPSSNVAVAMATAFHTAAHEPPRQPRMASSMSLSGYELAPPPPPSALSASHLPSPSHTEGDGTWARTSLLAMQRRGMQRHHSIAAPTLAVYEKTHELYKAQRFLSLYRTTRTVAVAGDTPFTPAPRLDARELAAAHLAQGVADTHDSLGEKGSGHHRANGATVAAAAATAALRMDATKPGRRASLQHTRAYEPREAAAVAPEPLGRVAERVSALSNQSKARAAGESEGVAATSELTTEKAHPPPVIDAPASSVTPPSSGTVTPTSNATPTTASVGDAALVGLAALRPDAADTLEAAAIQAQTDAATATATAATAAVAAVASTSTSSSSLRGNASWSMGDVLEAVNERMAAGDECIMASALEAPLDGPPGYYFAAIVSHKAEQCVLLGLRHTPTGSCALELVVPIARGVAVDMTGDGGFALVPTSKTMAVPVFKPASVLSMWTMVATLQGLLERADDMTEEWDWLDSYYLEVDAPHDMSGWERTRLLERRAPLRHSLELAIGRSPARDPGEASEAFLDAMIVQIRYIIERSDLDDLTSKQVRLALEEHFDQTLKAYKSFIDEKMIMVLGQMEPPSKIDDQLYLGTAWNASNLDELKRLGITHILNVTVEVPSFFVHGDASLKYLRIAVVDEPEADLREHWDETYRFLDRAQRDGGSVLVHCKMGVSRSASTVLAYLMKAKGWSLTEAFDTIKARRPVVQPNEGFWAQLQVYEGMLRAFNTQWLAERDIHMRQQRADTIADLLEVVAGGYRMYSYQLESHFKTVEGLRAASVDDLCRVGLPPVAARNIANFLEEEFRRRG